MQPYTKLPIIEGERFSGLTSTSALLQAEINPDFIETTYEFEYATEPELLGTPAATLIPGDVSLEGSKPTPVSVQATHLEPGQQYFYRAVAVNEVTENTENANEGRPVIGPTMTVTPFAYPAVTTDSTALFEPLHDCPHNREGHKVTIEVMLPGPGVIAACGHRLKIVTKGRRPRDRSTQWRSATARRTRGSAESKRGRPISTKRCMVTSI